MSTRSGVADFLHEAYTFIGIPLVNWVKIYLMIPGLMSAQRSGGLANICHAVQMHTLYSSFCMTESWMSTSLNQGLHIVHVCLGLSSSFGENCSSIRNLSCH